MTISRINPPGWGIGDKFTSAQANGLDNNTTYALDKRSGYTDTLQSVVTASGAGRIIKRYAAGADADTTYLVSGANDILDVATLTANRIYTLSNTNAQAGDRLFVLNRSSYYVTVKNAAATTLIVLGSSIANNAESGWAEFVHTGSSWILSKSSAQTGVSGEEFTADGTYTAKLGVTMGLLIGWGGGGGGGGGKEAMGTDRPVSGGGGGGGAVRTLQLVALVPGDTYTVTIGQGGAGGSSETMGADGTDTTFVRVTGGTELARFAGAGRGYKGTGGQIETIDSETAYYWGIGGLPVRQTNGTSLGPQHENQKLAFRPMGPQHGGYGVTEDVAYTDDQHRGARSPEGYDGGGGGQHGNASSTYRGGGGGGGGGGGAGGVGASGGAGSNANSSGDSTAGSAGSSAAANTGAGGGGGGAAGCCSSGATVLGGAGGSGGSGKLIVIPFR